MIAENDEKLNSTDIKILSDPRLLARGIAKAAYAMLWEQAKTAWRYPIFDFNGNIVTHRGKRFEVKNKKDKKYFWIPGKQGALYYHDPEVAKHVANNNGLLFIANGEPSVLAYHEAGIYNVLSWFGETSVPKTLMHDLQSIGVTKIVYAPDNDKYGRKSAIIVRDLKIGTDISALFLDISEHVPVKGDTNDLWIACQFDQSRFIDQLQSKTLLLPAPETHTAKPTTYNPDDYDTDFEKLAAQFAIALGVSGTAIDAKGFYKKQVKNPCRTDKHPSGSLHSKTGIIYDQTETKTYTAYDVARALNIDTGYTPKPQKTTDNKPENASIADRIQSVTLPPLTGAHTVNMPYISEIISELATVLKENRLIVIRSGMGTGKTELIKWILASLPSHARTLAISAFEQLSVATAERFEMECYKSIAKHDMGVVPKLSICAKSLPTLISEEATTSKRELTAIDEFDQFMPQLKSNIYRNTEAIHVLEALKQVLIQSRQIIVTSAHITDLDVSILENWTGLKAYVIDNEYQRDMPHLKLYKDRNKLIETALKTAQKSDKPVAIPCGSLRTARIIERMAIDSYGIPEDAIYLYSSRNSHTDTAKNIAKDPNQHISKLKLFIYTYAAGQGLDYTGACAGVFGIFNNRDMTPAQDMQMMERARYADQYHAYVQPGIQNRETDSGEISNRIQRNEKRTASLARIPEISASLSHREFLQMSTVYQAQNNMTRNDKLSYFAAYAQAQGHKIIFSDVTAGSTIKGLWQSARDSIDAYDREQTLTNQWVTSHEFDYLRASGVLEEKHFYGRDRDRIEQTTGLPITEASYDLFKTWQKRQGLKLFTNVFALHIEDITEIDRLEASNGVPLENRSNDGVKTLLARRFLMALAQVDNFAKVPQALKKADKRLSSEWVDIMRQFMADHKQDIIDVFDARKDLSTDPFPVIQRILKRLGLRLAADGRASAENEAGKREYYYRFDGDLFEVMKQYAIARRIHLDTLGTDDNPLSKSRNEYIVLQDLDGLNDFESSATEYQRWKDQIEEIPI